MQNIYEILKTVNLEVPEDKKAEFNKLLSENYKTIAEVEKLNSKITTAEETINQYKEDIGNRDKDLLDLQNKLKEAGQDSEKLTSLQSDFDALKSDYDKQKTDYENKITEQQYKFAATERVNSLKFTSNGAKKSFMNDLMAKHLPLENDNLLGFDDFVTAYKEQDKGAFVEEKQEDTNATPKPFVSQTNNNQQQVQTNAFDFGFTAVRPRPETK